MVGTARRLATLTAISRIAGLARDAAIGATFGAGPVADAFFVAFRIPNFFRRVVAEGGISTALVPLLTRTLRDRGREAALDRAAAAGSAAGMVLAAGCVAAMTFSTSITSTFAPGFATGGRLALASWIFSWSVPYVFLVGMSAWATAVLHTFRIFVVPALGPVLFNLTVVAAVLLLPSWLDLDAGALVAGVLAGGALHLLVQFPALRGAGLRLSRLAARPVKGATAGVWRSTFGALAGGSVHQVNVLAGTVLASMLGEGAVSWLWYADRLLEFPLGIVAVAVGTAALPSLAGLAGPDRRHDLARTVEEALGLALAFSLPAALGLWLLAGDITTLLLERGRFDAVDSARTAEALAACAPGLVGVAVVKVLAAAFQVIGRARVPVACAFASVALNLLLGVLLAGPFEPGGGPLAFAFSSASQRVGGAGLGHVGIALASGLAALFQGLSLLALVHRDLPAWRRRRMGAVFARHALACLPMVGGILASRSASSGLGLEVGGFASTGGAIAAGGLAYLAAALALGSREVGAVLGLTGRGLSRPATGPRAG